MAKRKRSQGEFNAASMADIAFLLLIFFLLVTTFDTDKGLVRKLPPPPEDKQEDIKQKERNVLTVLVNSQNQLLVEKKSTRIEELREITKRFITNYGQDPTSSDNPKKAIVSLKNDRGTSYGVYIGIQNELTAAYNEVRNEYARNTFGKAYDALNPAEKQEVRSEFPMNISEAEPEDVGGN